MLHCVLLHRICTIKLSCASCALIMMMIKDSALFASHVTLWFWYPLSGSSILPGILLRGFYWTHLTQGTHFFDGVLLGLYLRTCWWWLPPALCFFVAIVAALYQAMDEYVCKYTMGAVTIRLTSWRRRSPNLNSRKRQHWDWKTIDENSGTWTFHIILRLTVLGLWSHVSIIGVLQYDEALDFARCHKTLMHIMSSPFLCGVWMKHLMDKHLYSVISQHFSGAFALL